VKIPRRPKYDEPVILIMLLILGVVCSGTVFYLFRNLRRENPLLSLVGLFCMAMGLFLLVLDLVLISFTHGSQYIPDYLQFKRLVSDAGFAGRWVLTVYVFISAGVLIGLYLLVRNLFTKFTK